VDTRGFDAGINRACELRVFDQPHRFARKGRQTFALARLLDPALHHPEAKRVPAHALGRLPIDRGRS
jgi:hypothetical protein